MKQPILHFPRLQVLQEQRITAACKPIRMAPVPVAIAATNTNACAGLGATHASAQEQQASTLRCISVTVWCCHKPLLSHHLNAFTYALPDD